MLYLSGLTPAPTSSFFPRETRNPPQPRDWKTWELFLSLQLQTLPQSFPEDSQGLPSGSLQPRPPHVPPHSSEAQTPPRHPQAVSPGRRAVSASLQDSPSQTAGAECRNMGSRTHCAASSGQITKPEDPRGSGGEAETCKQPEAIKSNPDKCSGDPASAAASPGLRSLPLTLPRMRSPPEVAQVPPGHQPPPHPQG